ncbi:MAG: tRNA (adenosine(37)-N6)-threonylcarbamoyltransferase complex dimerization subunit type 1 TsaB [Pseudanabaenaceae cyanobacterium]
MWALGIDTSGEVLHAAIADLAQTPWRYLAQCDRRLGRETSALAHPILRELWQEAGEPSWDTLAWVAVSIGPGSFTGTRVGVVAARTLGQQLDIPVFAIAQTEPPTAKGCSLLEKAWPCWQRGDRPSWETVYPLYGNLPDGESRP